MKDSKVSFLIDSFEKAEFEVRQIVSPGSKLNYSYLSVMVAMASIFASRLALSLSSYSCLFSSSVFGFLGTNGLSARVCRRGL